MARYSSCTQQNTRRLEYIGKEAVSVCSHKPFKDWWSYLNIESLVFYFVCTAHVQKEILQNSRFVLGKGQAWTSHPTWGCRMHTTCVIRDRTLWAQNGNKHFALKWSKCWGYAGLLQITIEKSFVFWQSKCTSIMMASLLKRISSHERCPVFCLLIAYY